MNEQQNQRPGTPRRRRRTRAEIIKENYLPTIIIAITVVLCAIFIITAMVKADADRKAYEREVAASIAAAEEEKRLLDLQAQTILEQAASEAAKYEYQTAIDLIDKFDGPTTPVPTAAAALSPAPAQTFTVSGRPSSAATSGFRVPMHS